MKKLPLALSLLLICLLCLTCAGAASPAEDAAYLEPKFIRCVPDNADSAQLFPAYDPDLITFLHSAAGKAYRVNRGDAGSEAELAADLAALGFSDCAVMQANSDGVTYNETDADGSYKVKNAIMQSNFFTASRTFTVGGAEKKVVLISIRGSVDIPDYVTDAMIGDDDGFHAGFYRAAQNAYRALIGHSYAGIGMTFQQVLEAAADPQSGCYILVTGHSLGGATASILTANFLNPYTQNPYNTFCCTFASLKVCSAKRAATLETGNILNIINDCDVAPKVGYLLIAGVQLGHRAVAHSTVTAEGGGIVLDTLDKFLKHSINSIYRDILDQMNADPARYYHSLYITQDTPGSIKVGAWSNYDQGCTIPPAIQSRFDRYEIVLPERSCLTLRGNDLRRVRVCGGWLYSVGESRIREDLTVESGIFVLGGGQVTVEGSLRLQTLMGGSYTGGSGVLTMESGAGRLTVLGSAYFQGGSCTLTAGTLALAGDLYVLPSTGAQAEMIFRAQGTHEVVLTGSAPQTVYFAPEKSEASYLLTYFNILRSENPNPILAPCPISMEQIPESLTFYGALQLDGVGNMIVPEGADVTLTANKIELYETLTTLDVRGSLTLSGDVSGGRIDVGRFESTAASLTVTGNLTGTALYFNTTQEQSRALIQGDYSPEGAALSFCNGALEVAGDAIFRATDEDGTVRSTAPCVGSVYEGSRLTVGGDLLFTLHNGDWGLTEDCMLVLRGDLLQEPAAENPDALNRSIGTLVLAGSTLQTVNAPGVLFWDVTLANTSADGVVFCHALDPLGVFNAYGRPDGTITPYRFPKGCQPSFKDTDGDGIPDCLDPDPLGSGAYTGLAAAISDGSQDGDAVRFLYSTAAGEGAGTSVILALYSGGRQVALRTVRLDDAPNALRELEVDLLWQGQRIDRVRIFQLDAVSAAPCWAAAAWGA